MVLFPNCKINLGLNIIRKREDGYHDIETVFYPIGLKDALEGLTGGDNGVTFSCSGLQVAGEPEKNLCVKAWHLLKTDFPNLPPVRMHLHKTIPMGAGLGGGSADGAFALKLIDQLCGLSLTQEQLIQYAFQLGSDCPFFVFNKACFATGRGEQMQPITLDLSGYRFVIVNPGIHVSTAQAFAAIQPAIPSPPIREIIELPIAAWKEKLVNDFETPVSRLHPAIKAIQQELYQKGALYAAMTGTGSTVYGLFHKGEAPRFSFNQKWLIFETD